MLLCFAETERLKGGGSRCHWSLVYRRHSSDAQKENKTDEDSLRKERSRLILVSPMPIAKSLINPGLKDIFCSEPEVRRISHQTRARATLCTNRWRSPLRLANCRWNSAAWTRPQRLESSIMSSPSEPESQVTNVEVHRSCKHLAHCVRVSISSSMLFRSNNYLYFLGICY